jgi:HEPN domain-containing protein
VASSERADRKRLAAKRISRAVLRLEVTAAAALEGGDVDGACAAAFDAYRMAAEALLVRHGLDPASDEDSARSVQNSVARFAAEIPAFAAPVFDRFRRTYDRAQRFDPRSAHLSSADALSAIETAQSAVVAVKALLSGQQRGPLGATSGRGARRR